MHAGAVKVACENMATVECIGVHCGGICSLEAFLTW